MQIKKNVEKCTFLRNAIFVAKPPTNTCNTTLQTEIDLVAQIQDVSKILPIGRPNLTPLTVLISYKANRTIQKIRPNDSFCPKILIGIARCVIMYAPIPAGTPLDETRPDDSSSGSSASFSGCRHPTGVGDNSLCRQVWQSRIHKFPAHSAVLSA